jgi:hypothetical protein
MGSIDRQYLEDTIKCVMPITQVEGAAVFQFIIFWWYAAGDGGQTTCAWNLDQAFMIRGMGGIRNVMPGV